MSDSLLSFSNSETSNLPRWKCYGGLQTASYSYSDSSIRYIPIQYVPETMSNNISFGQYPNTPVTHEPELEPEPIPLGLIRRVLR